MKRILALLIVLTATFSLYGCGDDPEDDVTSPSFESLTINEEPLSEDIYFAEKNELLRLDIQLDNPSNLEINSVTINGTVYRQSRFEDESTNNHIVFHFDVLRVPGLNDYTLESIEYTHDGVSSIMVEADNTWQTYVLESTPTATLESFETLTDGISVVLNLSDADQVISSARLELLYDGLVEKSHDLFSGVTQRMFDDLYSDTDYDIRVVADYERGGGHDVQTGVVLFEETSITTDAKTLPSIDIHDIVADKTSIGFDYTVDDPDDVGSLSSIRLFKGDEEVDSLNESDALMFDDVPSNSDYRIVLEYEYDLNDQAGTQTLTVEATATTLTKENPTLQAENFTQTSDSITFDLFIDDPDDVLMGDTLHIVVTNGTDTHSKDVALDALQGITFADLLSDSPYTIEVHADYDLNDGEGLREQVLLATYDIKTDAMDIPEVLTTQTSVGRTSMTIRVDATAFDAIRDDEPIELYIYDAKTDELLKNATLLSSTESITIDGLISDQTLRIEIEATYDLRDGAGKQTSIVHTNTFSTTANSAPGGTISNFELRQDGVRFTLSLNDPDETLVEGSLVAHLYEDDGNGDPQIVKTIVLSKDDATHTFDYAPHYDRAYTIEVTADYDLRDGEGVRTDHPIDEKFKNIRLIEKEPVHELDTPLTSQEGFELPYSILDVDGTIVEDGIRMTVDGTTYSLDSLVDAFVVDGLLSDTTYTVDVEIEYVIDGETRVIHETLQITTDAKAPAEGSIGFNDESLGEVTVDIDFTDIDETLVDGEVTLVLYDSDEAVVGTVSLTTSQTHTFSELSNDSSYRIALYGTIDRNDGAGAIATELDTMSYQSVDGRIDISYDEIEIGQESAKFEIGYDDPFNIKTGSFDVRVYDEADNELSSERLFDDVTTEVQLSELFSDHVYTIRVYGEVDYLDGEGSTLQLLFEETLRTEAKAQPIPEMTFETIEVGSPISVSLGEFEDVDEVYSAMTLILYEVSSDGTLTEVDTIAIDLESVEDTYTFDHTHDETKTYRVELRGDYDLNDTHDYTNELLSTKSVITIRP